MGSAVFGCNFYWHRDSLSVAALQFGWGDTEVREKIYLEMKKRIGEPDV